MTTELVILITVSLAAAVSAGGILILGLLLWKGTRSCSGNRT